MSMKLLILVIFAICLSAVRPAFADPVLDGIATLPGSVEDVRIGGTWERDGTIGAYRIVVARTGGENVTARMFVQWVVYRDDGGAAVENTIEITELGDLKVDIVDFTSESDQDGLSVYIQTLDPNGNADENYELFVFSPTKHRFGPASN
ncbi:MAG: hypothetical protein NUV72_03485 [Bauldia sp.]|nr:hypothetical protein [Bauldia sp.]